MTLIEQIRTTIAKRAEYTRTLRELEAMPLETAIDLDLNGRNLAALAHHQTYGR